MENLHFIKTLEAFIKDQPVGMISLIISCLDPEKGLQLLWSMNSEKQAEILYRLSYFDTLYPKEDEIASVISQLESLIDKLKSKTFSVPGHSFPHLSGKKTLLQLLENCSKKQQKQYLKLLAAKDKQMAGRLKDEIIEVEDILLMPNHSIQLLLREVDRDELCIILKNNKLLQKIVLRNLNARSGNLLKEDIEFLGPITLARQKKAKRIIVTLIRKLVTQGKVVIPGKGDNKII